MTPPAMGGPAMSGPAMSGPAISGPAVSGPAISGPAVKNGAMPPAAAVGHVRDATRRVARCEADVVAIQAERHNLKWFVVFAGIAPLPVWLLLDWPMALTAAAAFMLFYIVGRYLNFMHIRNARQHVEDARMDLIRLERKSSREPDPIAS